MFDLKEILLQQQDVKYKMFQKRLIKTEKEIIGVRLPILRVLVKKYPFELNEIDMNHLSLEEMLMLIIKITDINKPFNELKMDLNKILPYLDNWQETDTLASSLKHFKHNQEEGLVFIYELLKQDTFQIRLGLALLLNYYINDFYLDEIFSIVESIKNQEYYVKMAIAWLLSFCFIKYPKRTKQYLKISSIDDWTYNKTIQKCIESHALSDSTKLKLREKKKD